MIIAHCPHDPDMPAGYPCEECRARGVGVVDLDAAESPGLVAFEVSPALGLSTGELRALLGADAADEALVERKLMDAGELAKAGGETYEADPTGAERSCYEAAMALRLNERLTTIVGESWRATTLLIIPENSPSWAGELLRAGAREVQAALQATGAAPSAVRPASSAYFVFKAEVAVSEFHEEP